MPRTSIKQVILINTGESKTSQVVVATSGGRLSCKSVLNCSIIYVVQTSGQRSCVTETKYVRLVYSPPPAPPQPHPLHTGQAFEIQ